MTSIPNSSRLPDPPERHSGIYRWIIIILGIVLVLLMLNRYVAWQAAMTPPIEVRKLGVVPPFVLTERSGKTVTNHDLAGKIWIADFIYTTCPGPCPILSANMAKLQGQVAQDPKVQLVSFTVDPDTDTPGVLAKYADQYGADPNRWWFLTGPKKPLFDLIQNGFLQVVQDNSGQPPQEGQYKVTHSTYLALVDGDGNLRGFYDGTSSEGRSDLLRDIKLVEKEGN